MKRLFAVLAALGLLLTACGEDDAPVGGQEGQGGSVRVALGDIESIETLALFIALERCGVHLFSSSR